MIASYPELFSRTVIFLALRAQTHTNEESLFVIRFIKISSSMNASSITFLLFKSPKITGN